MINASYDARFRGPIADGRADRAAHEAVEDVKMALAERGQELVLADYRQVHRYHASPRTGRAARSVRIIAGDRPRVTSGRIVYGAWLEGMGSRNKTTRFKGYWTFRRMAQRLRGEAVQVATGVLARFLPRMGGR